MQDKLVKELEGFESQHGVAWNEWNQGTQKVNGRDVLISNILRHYEAPGGLWREKQTGQKVDIQLIIAQQIMQKAGDRLLIRNRDLFGKYVSPFSPRSADKLARHKEDMARVIKSQMEREGYVFITTDAENKVIDILSEHFIAEDGRDGVLYHRVSSEGIVSPQAWTFEDLTKNVGIYRFIDQDKTELNKGLINAKLRDEAAKISGEAPGKGKDGEDGPRFTRTLEQLKRADAVKVGKKVTALDPFTLKEEFRKQAVIETGWTNPTLHERSRLESIVQNRLDALNSIEGLEPHFQEIKLPELQTWDI